MLSSSARTVSARTVSAHESARTVRLDHARLGHLARCLFVGLLLTGLATAASAADCWRITGWTSLSSGFERATLAQTTCTTVPDGTGWILPLGSPNQWTRIDLNDPHVSSWTFNPLLIWRGLDAFGWPIIETDLMACVGCANLTDILPYPPEQGVPTAGSRVKLRHVWSNKCIQTSAANGQPARNASCRTDDKVFVLDAAGGGTYRLRNEDDSQCLYATPTDGQPLYHWGCWNDPNMRFQLEAAGGGYRLRHVDNGQCPYGAVSNGGIVRTWGCWNDPNMVYRVDIVQY